MQGFRFDVAGRVVYPVEARMDTAVPLAHKPPHYVCHDSWVADYSVGDCGECRTEFTGWMPRPVGIAHLYPPGRRYMEKYPPGRCGNCCYIKFGGENAALRRAVENSGGFARIVDDGRLGESMKRAIRAAQEGNSNYYECFAEFSRIVDILENLPAAAGPDYLYILSGETGAAGPLGKRVRAYLERNYRGRVAIPAIARELGISESTLSHRYRAECGESVFDTLLGIRVEQSLPLLLKGMPLKTVAEETGFSNAFYYSRVFKRRIGVSPARYRRGLAGGSAGE